MSATAVIRSQKWRTFFGSSSTMPEMLISTTAKAKRRAASVGSHEVTTESAHHASVANKAGPNNSLSRLGSWWAVHAASAKNIPEKLS
jgi:hypothetical protein